MGSPKTFFLHLSLLVSSFTPRAGPERLPLSAYSRPRRVRTTVEAVYRNTKKNRVISYLNGAKLEKTPLSCHKGVLYEAKCRI